MRWLLIVVLLTALIVTACGGDGEADNAASPDVSAEEVVNALQEAGIPIADYAVFDEESDPNELLGRPGEYTSKVNFHDERLDPPAVGQIETEHGGPIEVIVKLKIDRNVRTISRTSSIQVSEISLGNNISTGMATYFCASPIRSLQIRRKNTRQP